MIAKLTSRKLWAWAGACVLLATGNIDQQTWLAVTAAYIGGQAVVDALAHFKRPDA
jgi:hypothetical protein